ncbi:energy transducer TonB [Parasediminibacterium sp. JCM 36343]|uniref:energy transducer TonB n=1 Tax=Parasediminibacterium sp. JCM 36343 TaxID=3374279 RepID=UPI00397D8743
MKFLSTLVIVLIVFAHIGYSQDTLVKYYDSSWNRLSTKENARFYLKAVKEENLYKCKIYYLPSMNIYSRYTCKDTALKQSIGLDLNYHENGQLKDSSLYSKESKHLFRYSFYESGKLKNVTNYGDSGAYNTHDFYENNKLRAYSYRNKGAKESIDTGYDESGNIVPDYIYMRAAVFPGGPNGWVKFLQKHLDSYVPTFNFAPRGKYTVMVAFMVNKEGKVQNIRTENDPGYGTKKEAMRVMSKSPDWEPAIEYNQPVNYTLRQAITFIVSGY